MPRPDLRAERSGQILDAFARCVARKGLDATSLADVAREAGLRRPLVRHHIGNRDDLIRAFVDRLDALWRRQTDDMRAWFAANPGGAALSDYLFHEDGGAAEPPAVDSIFTLARHDAAVARRLSDSLDYFADGVAAVLRMRFPEADETALCHAAAGIVAIYGGARTMAGWRSPPQAAASAPNAVDALAASLAAAPGRS